LFPVIFHEAPRRKALLLPSHHDVSCKGIFISDEDDDKLGEALYEVKLRFKQNRQPVRMHGDKVNPGLGTKLREALDDFQRRGGISLSNSDYASPLVAVMKGDGSVRITTYSTRFT